jgi:hypothetical protein
MAFSRPRAALVPPSARYRGRFPGLGTLVSCLLPAWLLALPSVGAQNGPTERRWLLVDDRDEAVRDALDLCWFSGTSRHCKQIRSGDLIAWPEGARTGTLEGARYGPTEVDSSVSLGRTRTVVPRKALLRGPQAERSVSLYPADSENFEVPAARWTPSGLGRWVPAGRYVASIRSADGVALRLLLLEPGADMALDSAVIPGSWAVLIRVRGGDQPLENATVSLEPVAASSPPTAEARKTDPSGLAVFQLLGRTLYRASIVGPEEYVPERASGLASAPGTFHFREVSLRRAATLVAEVFDVGAPLPGATCEVRSSAFGPRGEILPTDLDKASTTDRDGRCRIGGLVPGELVVRVSPGYGGYVQESVVVGPGETGFVTAALERTDLTVEARREDEGIEGLHVVVFALDRETHRPVGDLVVRGRTDDTGIYEGVLAGEGQYEILVSDNGGVLARKRLTIAPPDHHETFKLAGLEILGTVVDDRHEPVADAAITYRTRSATRLSLTSEGGRFRLLLAEAGDVELMASKRGYEDSEPLILSGLGRREGVELSLRALPSTQVRVTDSRGTSIAGAEVVATRWPPPQGQGILGATVTDEDGLAVLSWQAGGDVAVFVGGPRCALSGTVQRRLDTGVPLEMPCGEAAGHVLLRFVDPSGRAMRNESILLSTGGLVVPLEALGAHLKHYGLSRYSDSQGVLFLASLAPGYYEAVSTRNTTPAFIVSELREPMLAFEVLPASVTEYEIEIQASASP